MAGATTDISTRELWAKLFQAPSIDAYLNENGNCELPSFSDYLAQLCEARGIRPESVIKRSNLERSFGYRLFSGTRNPSRDTVLQLAFGFGLSTDETQQLLKVAQATQLHPKVKRDAIVAYCLHRGCSLIDAQQILYDNGLPILGGRRNAS